MRATPRRRQGSAQTSWQRRAWRPAGRPAFAVLAVALVAALTGGTSGTRAAQAGAPEARVSVIVRQLPGAGDAPETLVEQAGGTVGRQLGIIDGFTAVLPRTALARLRASHAVRSVTVNQPVRLASADMPGSSAPTTVREVAEELTGAGGYWDGGVDGNGVDVALLDSGVVEVDGLRGGKVLYGPDLSFENHRADLRNKDTFGHGTHMAGIIAGRDDSGFAGMAPGARLVSLKLADAGGATDVSQVIAGIDWVVQHRNRDGLNIRVLNLSFGTDGVQDYRIDPLAYAVEVAWRKGIVVVVAAGNEGAARLNNPAYDPHVLAIGAADTAGTATRRDDTVPAWSSRGDGTRNPDLVAPGTSIISLRDPGSAIDLTYPSARVGDRFFKGTGTSQAAAVVSGAAALVVAQRPEITPDQVKQLVTKTARKLRKADAEAQGDGMLDLAAAGDRPTPTASASRQRSAYSTGTGSLEAARGTMHVQSETGEVLEGEQDARGETWDGRTWSEESWDGRTWSGGSWSGRTWSGGTWSGRTWSGRTWSSGTWEGRTWSGRTWSGRTWSGRTWSGRTWSSEGWF
jgi:serine protease AprX